MGRTTISELSSVPILQMGNLRPREGRVLVMPGHTAIPFEAWLAPHILPVPFLGSQEGF